MYRIVNYVTPDGKDVFRQWLQGVRDSRTRAAFQRRLVRVAEGNFGDHKHCRDGLWELRIDVGPGYRIYYGRLGQEVVLLLGGGDKSTQSADIARAIELWRYAQKEERP